VEADGTSGEFAAAEMSYRRAGPHGCDATGDVAATPPARSDICEGQDRRTDKEREGRRCEDHERWRRRNDDNRRR
jgi:hypothetical protein